MTTLFRSRHDAEEFAARVDATSRPRAASGQPDARLDALVGVASSLRSAAASPALVAQATPRADFSTALRERLMAEAATVLTPAAAATSASLVLPTRQRGRRERRLVAAATAAVLLGGTASVAAAAQSALPGEALYPIKRALEQADVSLSGDAAGKGTDLLGHATGRLDEVSGLLARGGADTATSAPRVEETLADFDSEAREGADLLLQSYAQDRDEQSVATVRSFAADGLAAVERLSAIAPESSQGRLRDAALTLRDIDRRASDLCAACSDLPALAVPSLLLASADVQAAMARVDGNRTGLDNSHPVIVSKNAVRQAASAAGRRSRAGSSEPSATGVAPSAPQQAQPSVPGVPSAPSAPAPSKLLPKTDLGVKADKLVDDPITKVVQNVVPDAETLLPDTDAVTDDATDLLP